MVRPLPVIVASVLVLAAGVFAWHTVSKLENQVGDLGSRLETVQGDLERARREAEQTRQELEARAEQAEEIAVRLSTERDEARGEASTAAEKAAAEARRAEAAEALAATEAEARAQAETAASEQRAELAAAETKRQEAQRAAEDAQIAAWRAQLEADKLREERERNLARLERAMGQIAATRRTALGLVMNLGDSIEFDFDQAALRPEAREILARIAGVLLTAEGFGIQVFGHTDDVGSAEYNQELSERRAQAVTDYLIAAGVSRDKISSRGYGKAQPLVVGTDTDARQRNRRVEIAVVEVTGAPAAAIVDDASGPPGQDAPPG